MTMKAPGYERSWLRWRGVDHTAFSTVPWANQRWFAPFLVWPANALLLFILLLPLHVLILTALLTLGAPIPLLRALAAWKELTIVGALATLVWRAWRGGFSWRSLRWPDWAAVGFLGLACVYAAAPSEWFNQPNPIVVRLYALRDAAFFVAIYLCGRFAPQPAGSTQWTIVALVALGGVASVAGAIERFFLPIEAFVALGVVRYHNEFLNLFYNEAWFNPWRLPDQYWSGFGQILIRRSVSIFLSSQPFALSFLLVLPATLIAAFNSVGRRQRVLFGLATLCLVALALTATRASIAACLIQLALVVFVYTRQWLTTALTTVGAAVAMVALIVVATLWFTPHPELPTSTDPSAPANTTIDANDPPPATPNTARNLILGAQDALKADDPSALGHRSAWGQSLYSIREKPLFGHGLGTAGQAALRFNPGEKVGSGGESMYFKYTGEMGLVGFSVWLSLFVAVVWFSARQVMRADSPRAAMYPLFVLIMTIGVMISGISTPLFEVPFMLYCFWWLAGTVIALDRPAPTPA